MVEGRIARRVLQGKHPPWIRARRFPVLESGARDPASMELEPKLIRTLMGMRSTVQPGSPEHRWATQQTSNTFQWSPTAEEARAIGHVVSRRAKRSVLGGRPLRLEAKPTRQPRRSRPNRGAAP